MGNTDINTFLFPILRNCSCGKEHLFPLRGLEMGNGAVNIISHWVKKLGSRPFIVSDKNTERAAGQKVKEILGKDNIPYTDFIFDESPVPDENAIGGISLHFDRKCDVIVAVGSGVINDSCKIIANITNLPYIIIATAPSMDGYSSATSSMEINGLKVSVDSHPADVIIADSEILKNAPLRSFQSGIGDMIAKYVSICEWKISHIVTNEYYCDNIADAVIYATGKVVKNIPLLTNGDKEAALAVFEGLLISGLGMNFAGCSRPASGCEHYFSHFWDMRALEFGTPNSTHGINCGVATVEVIKRYEKLKSVIPSREKAEKEFRSFDMSKRQKELEDFVGRGGKQMADAMPNRLLYDKAEHEKRVERIISHWDEILEIINSLPKSSDIEKLLDEIGAPKCHADLNHDDGETQKVFSFTRDIRDKYILSSLCFDLGLTDEINEYGE